MKTPDWSQAPEWANYVAMDADGEWFWYAEVPHRGDEMWFTSAGKSANAETTELLWVATLSARPNSNEA